MKAWRFYPVRLFPIILIQLGAMLSSSADEAYARLLATYASDAGVDYEAWAADASDLQALDSYLDRLAETDVEALSESSQIAYYINLYNAAMLQVVLEAYPIDSVTSFAPDFGIFKRKYIRTGGELLSLDDVEKGILLTKWKEPRVHFGVNCASESCPPLRAEPFTGEALETQLQEQTAAFVNSERAVKVLKDEKLISVNPLLLWYKDEFSGDDPLPYLNRYLEETLRKGSGWRVEFFEYDWALNES